MSENIKYIILFDVTTKFIELKIIKHTELSLENSRRWNASCQLCPSMDIIMSHVLGEFEIAIFFQEEGATRPP